MLVINWIKGFSRMQSYYLLPLYQNIQWLCISFSHISFDHVYGNINQDVYLVSNPGLTQDQGVWKIKEIQDGAPLKYLHDI